MATITKPASQSGTRPISAKTITRKQAEKIAFLPKPEGRQMLKDILKCSKIDEDKDLRQSIFVDFLYDTLMFGADKGFSWQGIACIVTFAELMLAQIKQWGTLTEILELYSRNSLKLCGYLGERDYKIFTEHMFKTILPHFKLYKLVFSNDRDQQRPHVQLKVEPPFDAMHLQDTKPLKIWNYEQQIEELGRKESERANQRLVEKEKKLSAIESECKQPLKTEVNADQPLDKQKVEDIMQEVIQRYMTAATENMVSGLQDMQEGLEYKLEVTSLPRPQALGPPPRFSNSPTVKTPTTKAAPNPTAKSPKPGSRSSSRNRKK